MNEPARSKLLRPTGGGDDFRLNAIVDHFHEDDYTLAHGFAGAGEKLIEQWVTTRRADDSLLMPIIWLYRHGMELAMKQAVRDASKLSTNPFRHRRADSQSRGNHDRSRVA